MNQEDTFKIKNNNMRYLFITLAIFVSLSISFASCSKKDKQIQNTVNTLSEPHNKKDKNLKITIGTSVFIATLVDNQTTSAFKALLPITIQMSELNGNEKFYYFKKSLPTNASTARQIQSGDLMLYGDNCLVLFYENFNTSYSYTRLGKIENVSGLTAALGSGNVTVKFELE